MGRKPYLTFVHLAQRYGNVFSVRLGTKLVVVLNGRNAIREAFVTKGLAFSGRPNWVLNRVNQGKGNVEGIQKHALILIICFNIVVMYSTVCLGMIAHAPLYKNEEICTETNLDSYQFIPLCREREVKMHLDFIECILMWKENQGPEYISSFLKNYSITEIPS